MKSNGRKGPRPQVWKVQGEIPHNQYIAWLRMKSQAVYRNESWDLSFNDFQTLWQGRWDQRGRGVEQYCLARIDPSDPWCLANTECITRLEHLRARKHKHLYETRS